MKRILSLILALSMIFTFVACGKKDADTPITELTQPSTTAPTTAPTVPTTEPPTEPAEPDGLIFEGESYDSLDSIMEALSEQGRLEQEHHCITIEGLQTPVTFYLNYEAVVSYTAFGYTFDVEPEAKPYTSLYGNVSVSLYDYQEAVILNVWYYEIGYTLIMMPDGSWTQYPTEGRSLMVYANESEGLLCQETATKFNASLEHWDTAAIDLAHSRDDFYYATGTCTISDGNVQPVFSDEYTISDKYDLDAIFAGAKSRGEYPEFETVDQLLEYNRTAVSDPDDQSPLHYQEIYRIDGSLESRLEFFNDYIVAENQYDSLQRLMERTIYDLSGQSYTFVYTYGDDGQLAQISCLRYDTEVFCYRMTYDQEGFLLARERIADGEQTGLHTYTYDANGSTETYIQDGETKYTYYFDPDGNLYRHVTYQNGVAVETEDVGSLVKAQLLLEARLPIIDNGDIQYLFQYDGCNLIYSAALCGSLYETTYDGSFHKPTSELLWPEEDEERLELQYTYDDAGRLTTVIAMGEEDVAWQDLYSYEGDTQYMSRCDGSGALIYETENRYDNGRLWRYMIQTDEGEVFVREYQYSDDGTTVNISCYRDGELESEYTETYNEQGLLLSSGDFYNAHYHWTEDGMLQSALMWWSDYPTGIAFFDYRVVYVTEAQAQELADIFNKALQWLY